MPLYDLSLVIRALPRQQLIDCVKDAALKVTQQAGVIRTLHFMGERQLPQRSLSKDEITTDTRGNYFLLACDLPVKNIDQLMAGLGRDQSVIKRKMFSVAAPVSPPEPCTLEDEMKPPARRLSVEKMIVEGRKNPRHKSLRQWTPDTGLDFYPFHR